MQGLNTFAPSWFYRSKFTPKQVSQIKVLFKEWLEDESNFTPRWRCNVQTSFNQSTNDKAPWNRFFDALNFVVEGFSDVTDCTANQIKCGEVWANIYNKGDFQEYHTHSASQGNISFVYFHTVPTKDSLFSFYSNSFELYEMTGLSDVLNNIPLKQARTDIENIKEGDIILFPAHYPHLVDPNPGNQKRITFSGNLQIINI